MKYFIISVNSIQVHSYVSFRIKSKIDCYMSRIKGGKLEIFRSFDEGFYPAYIRTYKEENWAITKEDARKKAIALRQKAILECEKRRASLQRRIWKLENMEEYLLPIDND